MDDPHRLARLRGRLISLDNDETLNRYVESARECASTPIGLVSLVMGGIQLFRAASGLPKELQVSRATARSDSFCQFVASSEEPFLVENTGSDLRVPARLPSLFGIVAYAGVPVYAGGLPVGSLCVLDYQPRSWNLNIVQRLVVLARKVSQRLDALGDGLDAPPNVSDEAAKILTQALMIERSAVEAGPVMRLAQAYSRGELTAEEFRRGGQVLTGADDRFELLVSSVRNLRESAARLATDSADLKAAV